MKLKQGVDVSGIRSEVLIGLLIADRVWSELGQELVVTSVADGKHSRTSLHYSGQAADLRTRYFADNGEMARQKLADALTGDYDVILERDHIHLEWQPKR